MTFDKIYKIVKEIPKSKVASYKQVGELSKVYNPRLVGLALHKNLDPKNIPCHRVIRSNGKLATGYAFGGIEKQREMLEKEGIKFYKDKVDLKKFLYNF